MAPSAKGWEMIWIVTALVGLATVTVILRVLARLKRRVGFGMDDYFCLASIILLFGMLVELVLWCAIGGNGTHKSELDPETMVIFAKIFLSNQFTYFVLSPAIKISIICFYRRVFTTSTFHRVTFGLNSLIAAWGAAIFLSCALQCRPLRAYWDQSVEGNCFDGNTFFIVNQTFNVVMDFVILGLPIPMIWGLQRAWQDKLALHGVFALGGFVCFASIYRIVVLFYIDPDDTTYTVYQATLWTHIEPSIGLVCSCLPIIRGLFPAWTFPIGRSKPSGRSDNHYTGSNNLSGSYFVSSPKSRDSVYIKMDDVSTCEVGSDQDRSTEDQQSRSRHTMGPMDITVRTDIEITKITKGAT